MGQLENQKIKERLKNLDKYTRLIRVNAGMGWVGKIFKRAGNKLVLENPRPLHGVPTGVSDLIGFKSVLITPDMVGQRVAIFLAEEFKTDGYKTVTPQQKAFIDMVNELGGIGRVVR